MKPVDFPERNVILAKDQPEYIPLPVFVEYQEKKIEVIGDPEIKHLTKQVPWSMTGCLELSDEEIEQLRRTKLIWFTQSVFGNPFQPLHITTEKPFVQTEIEG